MKNEVIAAVRLENAIYDRITDEEIAKSDMTTLLVDQIENILETEKSATVFVGNNGVTKVTMYVECDDVKDIITGYVEYKNNDGTASYDEFNNEIGSGLCRICEIVACAVKWRLASMKAAERIENLIRFVEMDSDSIDWDAVE